MKYCRPPGSADDQSLDAYARLSRTTIVRETRGRASRPNRRGHPRICVDTAESIAGHLRLRGPPHFSPARDALGPQDHTRQISGGVANRRSNLEKYERE